MPLLCTGCFEIFKDDLKYNFNFILDKFSYFFGGGFDRISGEFDSGVACPISNCSGSIIEVDELILPTIVELNRKGYYTISSCSGHYYDNCSDIYICFDDSYDFKNTKLPPGFKCEEDDENSTIRKGYGRSVRSDKLFKQIIKDTESLYEWARKLVPLY